MIIQTDKKIHILSCFILTIIIGLLAKYNWMIICKYWWMSPIDTFIYFTIIKEILLDYKLIKNFMLKYLKIRLQYNGTFDIEDIKANAIGCLIGGFALCIIKIFAQLF